MWENISLGLYAFWCFLLIFKLLGSPRNRQFRYRHAFFGPYAWHRNMRNWTLIFASLLGVLFLPLPVIFWLIAAVAIIVAIAAAWNFGNKVGNPFVDLCLLFVGAYLGYLIISHFGLH